MRIGIFTNRFYPSVGGVEVSSRMMARELAAMGEDVAVITRSPLDGCAELSEGYDILRTGSVWEIVRLAARSDIMVLRGGLSKFAFFPSWLVGARIIMFHEMARMDHEPHAWFRRFLLRRVRHHVGVSHASLGTIKLPREAAQSVIYNPVSRDLWSESIRTRDARPIDILFVGRLVEDKGVWILADALESIARTVRVSIVGEGPLRERLRDRLGKLRHVKVEFHGMQDGEALRALYAESRLLVMPSLVLEGMGMVVAEAMASGTPVVVSDQTPLRETMGSGGLTFDSGSPLKLRETLENLTVNESLWETLHRGALEERERFNATNYRKTLEQLVQVAGPAAARVR